MLDFLLDNPYLFFLLIYVIVRVLRGGKKEESAPAAKGAERAQALKPVDTATVARGEARNGRSLEERLQELASEWEQKLSGETVGAAPAIAQPVRPVMSMAAASAVQEVPDTVEVVAEPTAPEATRSFDTDRVFEPTAETMEARRRAFDFKQVGAIAGGGDWNPAPATVVTAPAAASVMQTDVVIHPEDEPSAVAQMVQDPDQLYRAIILSEVLGRPRALRPWRAAL